MLTCVAHIDLWPHLKSLTMIDCQNIVQMLADFQSPKLTTFVVDNARESLIDDHQKHILQTVSALLTRFNSLQVLIMTIDCVDEDVSAIREAAESVVCHSKCLRSLSFNCIQHHGFEEEESEETESIIQQTIISCKNVDDLAVGIRDKGVLNFAEVIPFSNPCIRSVSLH